MSTKTMKINWQDDGWYAVVDPTIEPLELVRIGDSRLLHQEAQEVAKVEGYTSAAFYLDPPSYMTVI